VVLAARLEAGSEFKKWSVPEIKLCLEDVNDTIGITILAFMEFSMVNSPDFFYD